jgi:two-component system, NtrC family, sensor histidine kinase HydH
VADELFDEMKRYVRFDEADGEALRLLAAVAEPHHQRIAEDFYLRLSEHEGARRVFTGPEQIARLKGTLCEWLGTLLKGPWGAAYYERRARIGRMHVKIDLPQRYMFGAMSLIRTALVDIANGEFAGSVERDGIVRAVDKVLDLELAIMLETYREAFVQQVRIFERGRAERLTSLGTLAAGLAHEIRNPLNSAHLQLMLVQRRLTRPSGPDIEGARFAADIVATEMQRLATLVEEFLQFARPQALRRIHGDLRGTVEEVLALVGPEAATGKVELTLVPGAPLGVDLDHERVKQVILNLLRNSIEAVGPGGSVVVRVMAGEEGALLEVEDDGPGLPSDDSPIFEPFFTTKPEGTGLGLAVVHRIVTDHGGRVTYESRPGRTVFRVALPCTPT